MVATIGVCARNEESLILSTLDSIKISANTALKPYDWTLIICANGCTDNTTALVKDWRTKNSDISSLLIEHKESNLIEAQREIFNFSKSKGAENVIFIDADVFVDVNCVKELLKAAKIDSLKAVYADSIVIKRKKETLIEKVLNQYHAPQAVFTERKHLHGRTFLIKDWNIPITNPRLLIDDIYLSFYLLKKYGIQSIKMVPSAIVYFYQISSYKDFYNARRRRTIEMETCLKLFPEFGLLPSDQINRIFLWKKFFHEPVYRAYLWLVLLSLRKLAYIQYYFRKNRGEENWIPTHTSKSKA